MCNNHPIMPIDFKVDCLDEDRSYEDPKLIIHVYEDEHKTRTRKIGVEVEEWSNRNKCHDSDIEDIENTLDDYEWELGRWEIEIHVRWIKTHTQESEDWETEWDIIKQVKLPDIP